MADTKPDQMKNELAALRAELDATFEQAPVAFLLVDADRKVRRINRAGLALLACTLDHVLGQRFGDVFCCFNAAPEGGSGCGVSEACSSCQVRATLVKTLESGMRRENVPVRMRRVVDGRELEVEFIVSSVPLALPDGQHVLLCIQDLSEHRRIEDELDKARRLESLGTLAGGIAHDFNNLLTAILGQVAIARMQEDLSESLVESLKAVEGAALRAADLTGQLLTFSSGGAPMKTVFWLSEPVRAALEVAFRGTSTKLDLDLPQDVWSVLGDPDQIRHAVRNVMLNAVQACDGRGQVAIEARNVTLDDRAVPPLGGGRYVQLIVKDNGRGIAPRDLTRVFDPYFTTRQGGTGLGLTAAYSIMRRHDGHITLESRQGKGTIVRLYLPAAEAASTQPKPLPSPAAEAVSDQRGRVLVMDDEDSVRYATSEMLAAMGWQVAGARDGREALELYEKARADGDPFDAVLLDLTVPNGMGGRETIKRLVAMDPKVKAIVTSGYHNDAIMANFWEYGFSDAIAKPYLLRDLDNTVRRVIHGPGEKA